VEEVASRDNDDVSLNQSRPAKSPKRPTLPIRSKSTLGSAHWTTSRAERATRDTKENTVLRFMAGRSVVLGDYLSGKREIAGKSSQKVRYRMTGNVGAAYGPMLDGGAGRAGGEGGG